MKPVIDLDKEYGIVLEGGGARGAYQVGACRALKEAGVKICAIAGTSVGALNGAFLCMDRLEQAEEIWRTISFSKVMQADDEIMRKLFDRKLPLRTALSEIFRYLTEGGMDVTPLKNLIAQYVDARAIRNSKIPLYVQTFHVDEWKEIEIDLQQEPEEKIRDYLLASAYIFPLFKNEKLHGNTYIDGGAVDNVPLGALVKRGYQDIICIRVFGPGREKPVKIPEDTRVLEIAPRVRLGNFVDFDSAKSVRNMKIGYFDAKRAIYGLKGTIYYIEENREEWYYFNHLVFIDKAVQEQILEAYHIPKGSWLRCLTEEAAPTAAQELKLDRDWDYKELYLAILEATAKLYRIPKYRIYTVDGLVEEILEKYKKKTENEDYPAFTMFITGAHKEAEGGDSNEFERTQFSDTEGFYTGGD